ncbi:MAG: hypothetical protein H7Y42_12565 [Chitinophagaceae bacterium]|nr:hypothetical protein [Chitinophagaceae bacterium]
MYSLMVKFFKTESYLRQFQSGLLYSQTFEYFRKLESDDARRCDPFEGLVQQTKIPSGKIQLRPSIPIGEPWKELSILNGIFSQFHKGNIFCLSRFLLNPPKDIQELYIDSKFDEFGDYYAIITNQVEYEERIRKTAKKKKIKVSGRMIDYIDLSNFSDKRSAFMKDAVFGWQSEFRLHFETDLNKALKFRVGDISDITMVGKLSEGRTFQYKAPF